MKFRQKITLSLLLYVIVLNNAAFAQVVEMPDPNLRIAIRETLNLPTGALITQADMGQLIELDAHDSKIQDLTGLEHATNLAFLVLGDNSISDLTPLAGLVGLEILWLQNNPISDFSPLANLTNLEHVDLANCQITDISPLANLTQLTLVNLRGNSVTNIKPLANLTQITGLSLDSNRITDVSPLASLTRLEWLEIQDNNIVDHSPLDALPLNHFKYDQSCEMPPLPLEPRLENRTFPSVFSAWGGLGWSSVLNQPQLSDLEQMSQHDLYFCCLMFGEHLFDTGDGWEVRGDLERAEQLRDDYIALNSNMVFLAGIEFPAAQISEYPEDWPYWLRDTQGEIVKPPDEGEPVGLIDFTNPGFQDRMVAQAVAVSECGLYACTMVS